jgi:hypothetical protein
MSKSQFLVLVSREHIYDFLYFPSLVCLVSRDLYSFEQTTQDSTSFIIDSTKVLQDQRKERKERRK